MPTWEDQRNGLAEQLSLPCMEERPTIAEQIFLVLARRWKAHMERQIVEDPEQKTPPRSIDEVGFACLLLSQGWGGRFGSIAFRQAQENIDFILQRKLSWLDELLWSLCTVPRFPTPAHSRPVKCLVGNLDHHKSDIRVWCLELGWMVKSWLPFEESVQPLLKNLADTIIGALMAAGLAAALFDDDKAFFAYAQAFTPESPFENQYSERLVEAKNQSIIIVQGEFWQLESACRKIIEEVALPAVLSLKPERQRV